MTLRERLTKTLLFFSILAYYLGGYFLINLWTETRTQRFHLDLPYEAALPFYPIFILGYLAIFAVLAFTYVVIQDLGCFKKTALAFILCVSLHFICFVLFPVEYHLRPSIDPTQGTTYLLVDFYYWLDKPYNCFPSLHISNAFLCAFILERYHRGLGLIFHPLAILISISVVLVKQHFIVDTVAGFFVAWVIYRWVWRRELKVGSR